MIAEQRKRPDWPRFAVSPEGASARFDCMEDIPAGWKLAKPLTPENAPAGFVFKSGDRLMIDGVEHAIVPLDQVKKPPGRPKKEEDAG